MADIEKHNPTDLVAPDLLKDLRQIIDAARSHVAATANYELTAMYWHIGNRINNEVLKNERAEYGKQIVSQVAIQLQEEYGTKGFEERTIRRMMQFAQMFPDFQIVSPLVSKLSWTHFLIVMPLKDEMQPGEEAPLGLLLCTEGNEEQIELLQLDKTGIRVAQYLTELPSKDVLLRQLQKSIEAAKENMPVEDYE